MRSSAFLLHYSYATFDISLVCCQQVAFHGPADVFPGLLVVAAKTQDDQDFIESQRHVNVAGKGGRDRDR